MRHAVPADSTTKALADWLLTEGLGRAQITDLVDGMCARLVAAGGPVDTERLAGPRRTIAPYALTDSKPA